MAPAGVYVAQDLWNIYASRYLSSKSNQSILLSVPRNDGVL